VLLKFAAQQISQLGLVLDNQYSHVIDDVNRT